MRLRSIWPGIIGAALALPGCSPDATGPLSPASSASLDEAPTLTVISSVKAKGYWTQDWVHTWTLANTANAAALPLDLGQTGSISYAVDVTRTQTIVNDYGATGEICLTTYTGTPAELNLSGAVEYYDPNVGPPVGEDQHPEGGWLPIPGVSAEVTKTGKSRGVDQYGGAITCYTYKVTLGAEPQATAPTVGYQFVTLVLIGNLVSGEPALSARTGFTLPAAPTIKLKYATASLANFFVCPPGFTCGPPPAELATPVALSDSRSFAFDVSVTNSAATCGAHRIRNVATLSVDGGGVSSTDPADTWLEYSCPGVDATIQACPASFWKLTTSYPSWVDHAPADLVGSVFSGASAYTSSGKLLSNYTLAQALAFTTSSGVVGAARDLLREGVANALNLEYLGSDVSGLVTSVNAALATGDRIVMNDLANQLAGQNLAGSCRLR